MNVIARQKPKPTISAEEMKRRGEALRQAYAQNRIEGLFCSPEGNEIFQSFVRGEIEIQDVGLRIDALQCRL